jgi:hypothetical protein
LICLFATGVRFAARARRIVQAGATAEKFPNNASFVGNRGTLRDWEQHRSVPDAPARALLLAIERDPKAMRRLLREPAS